MSLRIPLLRRLVIFAITAILVAPALAIVTSPNPVSAATTLPSVDGTTHRYIVTTESAASAFSLAFDVRNAGGTVADVYSDVLTGFAAQLTDSQVEALRADARVTNIELDELVQADSLDVTDPSSDSPVAGDIIPGRYIIRIKSTASLAARDNIATILGDSVIYTYASVFTGYAADLSPQQLKELKADTAVAVIEPDRVVTAMGDQTSPPWGLDRIDQSSLPLNGHYVDRNSGVGVKVYVVDSGIATHADFGSRLVAGRNFAANSTTSTTVTPTNTNDCNGHGTHVAGTIGGATYGVAKGATLVPVRVLDCVGSGSSSSVISGLDWVVSNHTAGAAVVNMSLGGSASSTLDAAVQRVIDDGVVVVVAAGNNALDACNYSPARVANAVTVGASTSTDTIASFSNTGRCVDMFAPGQGILSTWLNGGTNTISGTSMASPHVAGAAAVLWGASLNDSRTTITATLLASITTGKLTLAPTDLTSPNKLLFVDPGTGTPPGAPTGLSITAGAGTVTANWTAPAQAGSSPINGYTVLATPGNSTCTWSSGPLTCTMTGLAPGSYAFTVTASNIWGSSPPSNAVANINVVGTNDYFSSATPISTNNSLNGSLNDSNSYATLETNEPVIGGVGAGGGATLWYVYTATATGTFTATTAGSAFDTVLDAFSAPASPTTATFSNIVNIANNDDFGGALTSSVSFNATLGSKYFIRVASWGSARGAVNLNWNLAPPCPNSADPNGDFFCHARVRNAYGELLSADNTGANFETGEPAPQLGAADGSIWYKWTAPDNGTLQLSVGSFVAPNVATVLSVFTGSSLDTLARPLGWTDVGGTTVYSTTLTVVKDVVYYWRQTSFTFGVRGWFDLTHSFNPTPTVSRPQPPASASVKSGVPSGTVDVTWTASPDDGGRPIISYSATVLETGATCVTDANGRGCTISGLTNFTQYTLHVFASNAIGASVARSAGSIRPGMSNDMFAVPAPISGSGSTTGQNTYATAEIGEPAHARSTASHSMWFSYTPTANGLLSLSSAGSSFDTVIGVYTGNSISALTSVAYNDDAKTGTWSEVSFTVSAGTTYRIALDGYSGRAGNFTLSWNLVLPAVPPSPTAVRATTSRPRQVEITWTAPSSDNFPIIDYLVTASPGGSTCAWTSGPLTCSISGLSTGTAYTFTVAARNSVGYSAPSAPSNAVTPRTVTSITTTPHSWGVDRIDQATLPLNNTYTTANRGEGVVIFVVDTGIYAEHNEFTGRIEGGRNFTTSNPSDITDCQGHGTHVASTAAGSSYGVATGATIVPVRVLDCSGSGLTSGIISGLDYVKSYPLNGRRAVVNMSLGGGASASLNSAVAALVAANFVVVVAAGNDSALACDDSPAQEPSALTVAATDATDTRAWFSNFGSCVDLFAPGFDIVGAAITGTSNNVHKSGTSMAAPHAAGAAAIALAAYPTASATSINGLLVADATTGQVSDAGDGSPNRMLFVSGSSLPVETVPVTLKSVSPTRLFDTRTGIGGVPAEKVGGDYFLEIQVTGRNGVPLVGISAVSLNVTVTDATAWGYVTVYPCGERPNASSLNYTAGLTIANAVVAPLSSDGKLCFYSYSPVHLIADLNGSLVDGNGFESVSPTRLFDTRDGSGGVPAFPVGGDYVLEVPVVGRAGVPASGAGAVVLNVTATDTNSWGYVTVFPCGTLPNASNINFTANETVPNAVVAPISSRGTVCFYVYGSANLIADVTGYFSANVGFAALEPTRLEDTRVYGDFGTVGNDAGTGAPLRVTVLGRAGIPTSNVAAVSLNVTAIGVKTGVTGYVTVYPCGEPPNASNLNFVIDETVPNAVIAPVSSSGEVCIYVYGRAHILVDVSGYITSTL